MFTLPWPPFRHPLKTLPVSGKVKNPGSFISKSQLTILFDNPYIPIAGLIVDTVNLGVGQGYLVATPMQLANYAALLASKGMYSEPSLVALGNQKKSLKIWQDKRFKNSDWTKMHQALLGVIESDYGTARSIRDLKEFQVAGKSGTAELVSLDSKEAYQEVRNSELLRDHSIIIAFGPMPNPRYAVSVVIENGESGGAVAGPVAIEVLKSLINE